MNEAKKKPPSSRPNIVSIDLQDYKKPWLDWCRAQDANPSEAFRQIVKRLVKQAPAPAIAQGKIAPDEPEKPTTRKEVALTPSELVRVEAISEAEGFSVTKWIVALIRARLTGTAQFGQRELELLARSNVHLLAIGRNLNQIAKALNTTPNDRSVYRVAMIEELEATIKTHAMVVSNAMTANVERWKIK